MIAMERSDKDSNKTFYNTQRDEDRRRFVEQPSKRYMGETLVDWIVPQLERGDRVLDVAGGSGTYASLIARTAGVSVVGVDISESMVRQRREDPSLPFNLVGDMEALPFASESFDAVIFVAALHHVPDALPALCEARRVLRPGGRMFAREPNSLRAGRASAAPIAGVSKEFRISLAYLADRARQAGFEVDEATGLLLTMRLVRRIVRSPSLGLYHTTHAADRVLGLIPGIDRLGEQCMLAATRPGPGGRESRDRAEVELADLLACPACEGRLVAGCDSFSCPACGSSYPVNDGVPMLLTGERRQHVSGGSPGDQASTASHPG